MRLVRRLSAALSGVLLLQLSLLGSGTLCALQGPSAPAAAPPAMTGMTHGAGGNVTASTVMEQSADALEDPANGCGGPGRAHSCDGPWATGRCTSMSSCASSQPATVTSVFAWVRGDISIDLPEPRSLLAGPVVAPELPPPRA